MVNYYQMYQISNFYYKTNTFDQMKSQLGMLFSREREWVLGFLESEMGKGDKQ